MGVVIDRIAIVVGDAIIKDSDIDRDVRVTDFLNGQPLNMSASARKAAANRLIDQLLIRREVRIGDYPRATMKEAEQELSELEKQRFHTQAALQSALKRYGLTDLQVREQFQWQLTVLRFIDARFKPAVFISDEAVQKYYSEHEAELRREHPGNASLDALSGEIRDTLAGEEVNKLFFSWLDENRNQTKIQYLEESLR
jgi:parvulin-like peptidyl-prolyl isomerase